MLVHELGGARAIAAYGGRLGDGPEPEPQRSGRKCEQEEAERSLDPPVGRIAVECVRGLEHDRDCERRDDLDERPDRRRVTGGHELGAASATARPAVRHAPTLPPHRGPSRDGRRRRPRRRRPPAPMPGACVAPARARARSRRARAPARAYAPRPGTPGGRTLLIRSLRSANSGVSAETIEMRPATAADQARIVGDAGRRTPDTVAARAAGSPPSRWCLIPPGRTVSRAAEPSATRPPCPARGSPAPGRRARVASRRRGSRPCRRGRSR